MDDRAAPSETPAAINDAAGDKILAVVYRIGSAELPDGERVQEDRDAAMHAAAKAHAIPVRRVVIGRRE